MKRLFCFITTALILCSALFTYGQHPGVEAVRFSRQPKIDGILNDSCWKACAEVSNFMQYDPVYGISPTQRTLVRIGYDDNAIYVGAMMYDRNPDSILRELGNRDDDDLNADKFGVMFDTYDLQTDAWVFMVWASGVQVDSRHSDPTYGGVWQSAVQISDSGWSCEMRITWSAIRFPEKPEQQWGMQIFRGIRRNRELDQWALEVKTASNEMVYWGKLKGINNIKAPLRLSFTPFLSLYADHYPYNVKGRSNFAWLAGGGLDLKYGIDKSFTLDVTLLPDFSQVQSDYMVKNITAFETVYDDYRPFFNEAIDLFRIGDLFYSRRIGRIPSGYFSVSDSLRPGETIRKNPTQARLLNALKLSGRTAAGTGLGLFNAITGDMYAIVRDSSGNERKILTEPLTNYNVAVVDQILKNNSEVYFVNTNVIRSHGYNDANVSLLGFRLNNRSITWQLSASGGLSQQFSRTDSVKGRFTDQIGYRYFAQFAKVSGNFLFSVYRKTLSDSWNPNDMGLLLQNNQTSTGAILKYNIYEPFGKIRSMYNTLSVDYVENFTNHYTEEFEIKIQNSLTTSKYLGIWHGAIFSPLKVNNFYEPRVPGRFFVVDEWYSLYAGFSSDYRKRFALDGNFDWWQNFTNDGMYYSIQLTPIFRITDHFTMNFSSKYEASYNDVGFADIDSLGNIVFGKRDIFTVTNVLNARYIFRNNLSLSLLARHYWSNGKYSGFYLLNNDGEPVYSPDIQGSTDHDFNFNAFNIDLLFYWEFAPGSSLNITYKNIIVDDGNEPLPGYFENLAKVFGNKQLNSLSVKVIYYLDYQYLAARGRKVNKNRKI